MSIQQLDLYAAHPVEKQCIDSLITAQSIVADLQSLPLRSITAELGDCLAYLKGFNFRVLKSVWKMRCYSARYKSWKEARQLRSGPSLHATVYLIEIKQIKYIMKKFLQLCLSKKSKYKRFNFNYYIYFNRDTKSNLFNFRT